MYSQKLTADQRLISTLFAWKKAVVHYIRLQRGRAFFQLQNKQHGGSPPRTMQNHGRQSIRVTQCFGLSRGVFTCLHLHMVCISSHLISNHGSVRSWLISMTRNWCSAASSETALSENLRRMPKPKHSMWNDVIEESNQREMSVCENTLKEGARRTIVSLEVGVTFQSDGCVTVRRAIGIVAHDSWACVCSPRSISLVSTLGRPIKHDLNVLHRLRVNAERWVVCMHRLYENTQRSITPTAV